MTRRRLAALVVAASLVWSVTYVAQGQAPLTDREALEAIGRILVAQGIVLPTTTAPTTTTTAPTTTAAPTTTTIAPTTTTTVAPTTTTLPATTTTASPSGCSGIQVAAGANLVTVANAHAAGTTFCLAAGQYNLSGTGIPLQSGDRWVGALNGTTRTSILDGGDSATRAFTCTCSDGQIRNIIIEDFNSPLQSQPMGPAITNWLWDNIESRENAARGFFTWSGTILRNSYIHHNHQLGIAGNGTGALVENNEIAFNNYLAEVAPGFEGGGTKWVNTVNLTIRGNFAHHNCGNGLWADGVNTNVLFENNRAEDNWGSGIFNELNPGPAIIRNNTASRNAFGQGSACTAAGGGGAGGIRVNDSGSTEVYGNILINNEGGIFSVDGPRTVSLTGLYVHDNTITWAVGVHGILDTAAGSGEPFSSAANNRYENNDYHYNGTDSTPFEWAGGKTWAQWQAVGHDDTGTFD